MEIKINSELKNLPDNYSLQQVLDILPPERQKGIAVAVNQVVIPKNMWPLHALKQNDDILIINATQGG